MIRVKLVKDEAEERAYACHCSRCEQEWREPIFTLVPGAWPREQDILEVATDQHRAESPDCFATRH